MNENRGIRRDALMLLIGAAIGALFGILVAYPEMLASSRENSARIDNNQKQIELLWEAHQVQHETATPSEGAAK
jgi:hypothetical protein